MQRWILGGDVSRIGLGGLYDDAWGYFMSGKPRDACSYSYSQMNLCLWILGGWSGRQQGRGVSSKCMHAFGSTGRSSLPRQKMEFIEVKVWIQVNMGD